MNTPGHPRRRHDPRHRRPAWPPRSATSAGCSRRRGIEKTPLTKQLNALTQPDPDHRRRRAGGLDRPGPVPRRPAPGAVPDRGRVRGRGHPDGPAGGRHGHPVEGLADARRGRRDREAAPLGRDARLDVGAQLRQDRHPDAQPDDRRPDGDRRSSLRDHRRRLLDDRPDRPHRRPARRPARAVPAADGPVRRRRGPRRRRSSATRPRARWSSSPPRAASTRPSPASSTRASRPCRSTPPTR